MLYKKFHRQYLREWRVGRKFKFYSGIFKVTEKPDIDNECGYIRSDAWCLIPLGGSDSGQIQYKEITWLD